MKEVSAATTNQARAAQTKINRTREKILMAVNDLLREIPASDISVTAICSRAGMSTDPYYAAHHEGTRKEVDKLLTKQIQLQSESRPTKRRMLPVSMTAQQKIEQLEAELADVSLRHQRSVQALNVLSQVIDALMERVPDGTAVIKQLSHAQPKRPG